MTTVAWDGETLACDTQMSSSFIDQFEARKVFRVNGHLIAGAGAYEDVLEFVDWYKRGADMDSRRAFRDKPSFLVIRDGQAWECGDMCRLFRVADKTAIGSGAQFAMGAMLAGADARKAIQVAINLDEGTGGKVRTYQARQAG